jgi:hypothetical protein
MQRHKRLHINLSHSVRHASTGICGHRRVMLEIYIRGSTDTDICNLQLKRHVYKFITIKIMG